MSRHCAVIGCSGDYKLSIWQQDECKIHKVLHHNVGGTYQSLFKYVRTEVSKVLAL